MTDARTPVWLWALIGLEIAGLLAAGLLMAHVFAIFTPGPWTPAETALILAWAIIPVAVGCGIGHLARLAWHRGAPIAAIACAAVPGIAVVVLTATLLGGIWL